MPDLSMITNTELMAEVRKRRLSSVQADLSLVSIDEITAECAKRYPVFCFGGLVRLDNDRASGRFKTHLQNFGDSFECMGLASMMIAKAERQLTGNSSQEAKGGI